MKNKFLLVILSVFGLMGCDPIEGLLHVDKTLKVVHNKTETVTLNAGDYPMKLNVSGRKSAEIKIQSGSRELKLNLNISGKSIPDNGTLNLTGRQTGQPFDLLAVVKTTTSDSERRREFENCEIYPNQPVCGPNGCYQDPRSRWGTRDIEYIIRTEAKKMTASLSDPGTKEVLATLEGGRTLQTKIITRQGYCF